MAAAHRQAAFCAAFLAFLAHCVVGSVAARGEPPPSPAEMLEDAELADVLFLDPHRGWAVGDRGAIWRTDDGGQRWRLQDSSVGCRLESVCFIDADNGWIAGGWTVPYTHKSVAVLLRTGDGGDRWERIPAPTLPGLKRVKFFDARRGWALGDCSAMYPSGVFRSEDGGRSWTALPSADANGWLTGDFRDAQGGAAAGRDDQLGFLLGDAVQQPHKASLGTRRLRCLRLDGRSAGWLVGDGGLVLRTGDGGRTWQRPPKPLPDGMADQFDFAAVSCLAGNCWIGGSPGTSILYSPDGGANWEVFRTGRALPIRALSFADERHGWAVGSLGAILASRDGGRSWSRQRSGGERAALVGFFSEPASAPWELFALLSGSDGRLGILEILNRRDLESPSNTESSLDERTHQAAAAVGASVGETSWRFPLRQEGLQMPVQAVIDGWDRSNGGRGLASFEEHVVRNIRQWRPDVVVTEGAGAQGEQPLGELIRQVVMAGVLHAADPAVYPDQITLAGLAPWEVKKAFSAAGGDERGAVNIATAQLTPRLGRSLTDQAAAARGLTLQEYHAGPMQIGLQLSFDRRPSDAPARSVFSGIVLQPGEAARRVLSQPNSADLETLSRAAQKRRNVEQLLARNAEDPQGGVGWLGQLEDLTRGLDPSNAGEILFELGRRYQSAGRSELGCEVFELLANRYPDHPLAEPALLWLVSYYASGEAGRRAQETTRLESRRVTFERPEGIGGDSQRTLDLSTLDAQAAGPRRAVARAVSKGGNDPRPAQRAARAAALAKQIQRTRPALYCEPALRFPLAAALRAQGLVQESERHYRALAESGRRDAWRRCAESELRLLHTGRAAPKTVAKCPLAVGKPRLDGQLEDDVWQGREPLELKSAQHDDANWAAAVLLAHDEQFLYVAASCGKAPGADYPASHDSRPRDPDLNDRDRIDLLLDLDRDYATFYRFTIDHRGWTGEACLGDRTWDPQWFVAAADDPQRWTVEAAIPLSELSAQPPKAGDVWAVGIQRTVPGVGFQSWTEPAAISPRPEGFGWLVFE